MVAHARSTFPERVLRRMLGSIDDGRKAVTTAVELDNAFDGDQRERYELRPEDLLRAEREARERGLDLVGIFHSHPDCDAYFSETDLKNSCPWYSFVVLSVKERRVRPRAQLSAECRADGSRRGRPRVSEQLTGKQLWPKF